MVVQLDEEEITENKNMAAVKKEAKQYIKLYDTEEVVNCLKGLQVAAVKKDSDVATSDSVIAITQDCQEQHAGPGEQEVPTVSDTMQCTSCSCTFTDRDQQVQHYKTDWHRFNLKRRLQGQLAVSEDMFEEMTGDISSISGSGTEDDISDTESGKTGHVTRDSESDDEEAVHIEGAGRRHPRVFFYNQDGALVSIYRCVLHGKKNQAESVEELVAMATEMPKKMKWVVMMLAGGHFAAAVFEGERVVIHKTFHRYVVRAKRGTVQSVRDNQGNAPKSVGAFMRRHHEAALQKDIEELAESWSDHLKSCDRIFLRIPTLSRTKIFGGKKPILDKKDTRIRMVPFVTRRPTFKELKRVHDVLASVESHGEGVRVEDILFKKAAEKPKSSGIPEKINKEPVPTPEGAAQQHVTEESSDDEEDLVMRMTTLSTGDLKEFEVTPRRRRPQRKKKKKRESPPPAAEAATADLAAEQEEEDVELGPEDLEKFNELYTCCRVGDAEKLQNLLDELERTKNMHSEGGPNQLDLLNIMIDKSQGTLLHTAAIQGHAHLIQVLLSAGADPAHRNKKQQTAYMCADNKNTRNEFRKFMASHPEMYDYQAAQVPGPLTEEMENERKKKDAEKKKALKKARKEKLQSRREEEAKQRQEDQERKRYLALSDREKRALAAERRFAQQVATSGATAPVLGRCFQCAADITGKVPFEYFDYKFCSPKCLKEHKLKQKAAAS